LHIRSKRTLQAKSVLLPPKLIVRESTIGLKVSRPAQRAAN